MDSGVRGGTAGMEEIIGGWDGTDMMKRLEIQIRKESSCTQWMSVQKLCVNYTGQRLIIDSIYLSFMAAEA
jgi:hypothetical protein